MRKFTLLTSLLILPFLAGCGSSAPEQIPGLKAFVGAQVFDGVGSPAGSQVILVRDGRIEQIGPATQVQVPPGAETIDLTGKFVTPGWVLSHGHVGGSKGLSAGPEALTRENELDQLHRYADYGVTTVVSLGGEGDEGFKLRDESQDPSLDRARLVMAGTIITGPTPDEARAQVDADVEQGVDLIKIRVDDNLGSGRKMTPETYRAVIEEAHKLGKKVAVHIYYLDDAKDLLKAGADFIAHSVRDKEIDDEFISLMKERDICYTPTLMRDVSTYVYETRPAFFDDPFFLAHADEAVLAELQTPERQKQAQGRGPQTYKRQLAVAETNLKRLVDAGVRIALGTDTGPPARFEGYFEHMEMGMMVDAGMTPTQALQSATSVSAACMDVPDVGTLSQGKWADLAVFDQDPQADIHNSETLSSVWIAGNRVGGESAAE